MRQQAHVESQSEGWKFMSMSSLSYKCDSYALGLPQAEPGKHNRFVSFDVS
jgi:hypothetical protein